MNLIAENATIQLRSLLTNPIDKRGRAFFIENQKVGRRLAITDIHGCFQTFSRLLQKINLNRNDQLFILGDMIDRGPYSLLVLEKIWVLLSEGYRIYPLRGNHEHLFLNFSRETPHKIIAFSQRQYSQHLLQPSGELTSGVEQFLSSLPVYYETHSDIMVHAGFNTYERYPFEKWKDMIWIRDFPYDARKLKEKRILHGHVPLSMSEILKALHNGQRKLGLDNGCVRAKVAGFGKLVCFDLDSNELHAQKNRDMVPG